MLFTCSIILIFVLYIFYKKEQEKNKMPYYPLYQAIPFGNDIYNRQYRNNYLNYSNQFVNNNYEIPNWNNYNQKKNNESYRNNNLQKNMLNSTFLQSPSYFIHDYIDKSNNKLFNNENQKPKNSLHVLNGKRITFGNEDNLMFEKKNSVRTINAEEYIDNIKYLYNNNSINKNSTNKKDYLNNTPKSNLSEFISMSKVDQMEDMSVIFSEKENTNSKNCNNNELSNKNMKQQNSLKNHFEDTVIKKLNFTEEKKNN